MRIRGATKEADSSVMASDLHSMLKKAETAIHSEAPEECSLTRTTEKTDAKMRQYRNRATIVTILIEITLFATGASFWWQALAIFPTFLAVSSLLQERSHM